MKFFPWLLIIGVCFSAGCSASGRFFPEKPVQKIPYIIVYGRESCSACKTFKRGLDGAKVVYTYKDMKDKTVQIAMESRMEKAGLNTEKYLIPVIDVSGSLAIRPSLRDVLNRYGHPSPESHSVTTEASPSACQESGENSSSCGGQSR